MQCIERQEIPILTQCEGEHTWIRKVPAPYQGTLEDTEVSTTPLVWDDSTNSGEKGAICVHTKVHPTSTSSKSAGLIVILRVTHLHSLPPSRIATRVLVDTSGTSVKSLQRRLTVAALKLLQGLARKA